MATKIRITYGTPENVPCPTALNEGGKVNSDSGVPLVMIRQMPRTITIAASDVMK